MPLSPVSGNGFSTCTFTPATTSVSPKRARAEPSALGITFVSIVRERCSSNFLPSSRFPSFKRSTI